MPWFITRNLLVGFCVLVVALMGCDGSGGGSSGPNGETMAKAFKPGTAIAVKVVSTEGCVNTPPTIERIERVAQELGAALKLDKIIVAEMGEAQANRFFGSPTVQVNGLDLDPEMRDTANYGFTWRMYGASGVPTKEMIREAFFEAAGG